jgi:hypothetical protein
LKYKNNIFSDAPTLRFQREEPPLNRLVEGFDVFGVHIQYWMPFAVLMVVAAVAVAWWTQGRPP